MANILNIATSGLLAFQRGLDLTANNISNSRTPGYTRQMLLLKSLPSQRFAGSFIGAGVSPADIKRNSDRFATQQVRETLTNKAQYDIFYEQASQIDKLLSQDGSSISSTLQNFFNALGQLNESPDNAASRGVAFNQSQLLVDQFRTMQLRLDEYQHNNSQQLQEAVNQVNRLTADIAQLNEKISVTGSAPELLDNRDELLRQLAQYTDVIVVDEGNAGISVAIGSGELLVNGTNHRNLAVIPGLNGQSGSRLAIENGMAAIDVTNNLHSGMIGGLLDYEENVLKQASELLGQMAIGLATQFNQQQRLGMDMNNAIGKNVFTDFNNASSQTGRSFPSSNNTGTGVLSVSLSDISQLKLSDYELFVTDTGTNEVRILRKSDGQSMIMNLTSAPPAPPAGQLSIDGMTITVDNLGNMANGDRYYINPTKGAAGQLALAISDPKDFALAAPVRVQAAMGNSGQGRAQLGDIIDTSSVNKDFRIEFISDTQYNLLNLTDSVSSGPFSFTPNSDNLVQIPDSLNPSYSIILSGNPVAGDQFNASYNTNGFGDNRNGLKLAAIQKETMFEGGTETLSDRYANLLAQIGSKTNQAKLRGEAADILHKQALDFRDSKSAVNLDEEAANLIQFEQAYQAASKLLSVASEMMDVLFAAMR
ncbi:flagellar hook-associated protein FlgK [Legionella birminghamensis]|uniref:Flagellar hook-associated protein 1 n=1 Tax=Legionella birminghamensis TaxID=28083 RepID=A0A378I9R4_9GAMM|nr:flagellar hook-associated protein FlgK [Legionella birminghamensis]KTC74687.1 flagellar hook-associated protein FlgK [Legionella birminghamensis]STX31490.1 flagellar hook-associated protein 1 FlgK [Legionella birminghamensis]